MGEGTRCSTKHSLAKHSFKHLKYLSVWFSSEPQFPINKVDDESPQGAHLHTCAAYANELGIACYLDKAKFLKSSAVTNRDRKNYALVREQTAVSQFLWLRSHLVPISDFRSCVVRLRWRLWSLPRKGVPECVLGSQDHSPSKMLVPQAWGIEFDSQNPR